MGLHAAQTNVHVLHAFAFADSAARIASAGFTAADIGKSVKQTDDSSSYVIQSVAGSGVGTFSQMTGADLTNCRLLVVADVSTTTAGGTLSAGAFEFAANDFPSATFKFRIVGRVSHATLTVNAHLHNITDDVVVTGSTRSVSSITNQFSESAGLTLASGSKLYQMRATVDGGAGMTSIGTVESCHVDVAAASASGGVTVKGWDGLAEQSPLDSKSDYFSGTTLAAKWTEWDVDNLITVEVDDRLKFTMVDQGAIRWQGVVQTAPAHTRYTVTAWVDASLSVEGGAGLVGVLAGEDLIANPSTDGLIFISRQSGTLTGGDDVNVYHADTYAHGGGALLAGNSDPHGTAKFVRIFVDNVANTYDFLYSDDGLDWDHMLEIAQGSTKVPADPATIGILMWNQNTGEDYILNALMFRVDETTDMYLPVGSRVT